MKSNSLLTYVLYGLLGLFILAAGYYACQRQKEKKEQAAREAAELEETLRDMGYASEDTLAAKGSSYTSKDSLSKPTTGAKPNATTSKTTTGTKPNATSSKTTTGTKPNATTAKPAVSKNGIASETASKAKTNSPSSTTKHSSTLAKPNTAAAKKGISSVKGPGTGRWAVRAGTFTYTEGARRRLEEVIKAGYPNAEISKTKEGKAAVIVFRSNDKEAAIRVVDKLQGKGIDAAVFAKAN